MNLDSFFSSCFHILIINILIDLIIVRQKHIITIYFDMCMVSSIFFGRMMIRLMISKDDYRYMQISKNVKRIESRLSFAIIAFP